VRFCIRSVEAYPVSVFILPLPWGREENRFEFEKRKPDFSGEGFIITESKKAGGQAFY